jgi:hypothetical protein
MKRRQERADKKGDDLPIEVKFNKVLRAARDNYLAKGKAILSDVLGKAGKYESTNDAFDVRYESKVTHATDVQLKSLT